MVLGTLPDGKAFTVASTLGDNGSITLYGIVAKTLPVANLYGELTLANLSTTDVTGELLWVKPTQTLASMPHSSGVNTVLTANGCLYSAGMALPNGAATLTIAGGNLASDSTTATTLTAGKPTATTLLPSWSAKPAGGTFAVKVKDPARAKAVSGTGLYLPKSHSAWGTFPGVTVGGRISLTQP